MSGDRWDPNRPRRSNRKVDPRRDGPRPLADSLSGLAEGLGMAEPEVVGSIFGRWAEIVGSGIAEHCKPTSLRDAKLVVSCDDPGWANQIRFMTDEIGERIAAVLGPEVVTEISVRVSGPARSVVKNEPPPPGVGRDRRGRRGTPRT